MTYLSLSVVVVNVVFFFIVTLIEFDRRRRGDTLILPFSMLLTIIAFNGLVFGELTVFRLAMALVLLIAIYEARDIVTRNQSELSLAGAVSSGVAAAGVLTYWAVSLINEHLNLTLGSA